MTRVVILGLDGGTWKVLVPLMKAGLLPNLELIIENGASGNLASTIPPITSPAWPCMTTGLNPGKLGVYSTIMRSSKDKLSFKPVRSSVYKGKAVWDYLSDNGFHVALFKVPFLSPVYPTNGCMVSGFGSTGKFTAFPSYLHEKLVDGPSRLLEKSLFKQLETLKLDDTKNCVSFIQQLTKLVDKETNVVLDLVDTLRWDFLFYVISPMDWLQHAFIDKLFELKQKLKTGDPQSFSIEDKALINFYQRIDSFIGCILKILEKAEDDCILFLVSDHGFTIRPRTFNLAKWLVGKGHMNLKVGYSKYSNLISTLTSKILVLSEKIASKRVMERVLLILPTHILSSLANVYHKASASSLGSISKLINFDSSEAVCLEDRAIYFNPAVNERAITDKMIKDLEKFLEQLNGPKLKVFRNNEVYWGDKVELSPNLIIEIIEGDNIWEFTTDLNDPLIFRPRLPGKHDHNGIFSAYGPQIKKGVWLEDIVIWDVASTVLHIFNLPIPKNVDGKVLKTIFETGSKLAERKTMYRDVDVEEEKEETMYTYSQKEEEKIRKRLQSLGYI